MGSDRTALVLINVFTQKNYSQLGGGGPHPHYAATEPVNLLQWEGQNFRLIFDTIFAQSRTMHMG